LQYFSIANATMMMMMMMIIAPDDGMTIFIEKQRTDYVLGISKFPSHYKGSIIIYHLYSFLNKFNLLFSKKGYCLCHHFYHSCKPL